MGYFNVYRLQCRPTSSSDACMLGTACERLHLGGLQRRVISEVILKGPGCAFSRAVGTLHGGTHDVAHHSEQAHAGRAQDVPAAPHPAVPGAAHPHAAQGGRARRAAAARSGARSQPHLRRRDGCPPARRAAQSGRPDQAMEDGEGAAADSAASVQTNIQELMQRLTEARLAGNAAAFSATGER